MYMHIHKKVKQAQSKSGENSNMPMNKKWVKEYTFKKYIFPVLDCIIPHFHLGNFQESNIPLEYPCSEDLLFKNSLQLKNNVEHFQTFLHWYITD